MSTKEQLIGSKELKIDSFELNSGIYFLYNDEELVYIGQATNITRRILEHISEGVKVFNKVRYNLVPVSSLNDVETTLIRSLKPYYNMARKNEKEHVYVPTRKSTITFRPVALKHHQRTTGTIPIRIRFCYKRRYFYVPTNLSAYLENIDRGNIIDEHLLKDLRPILKKYQDAVKYISGDKTFEFVKNKILALKI